MKELSSFEIECVSGAGILKDSLTNIFSLVGEASFNALSQSLKFTLPIIGEINLGSIFSGDAAKTIGAQLGAAIGGTIENTLARLPIVGGAINQALGN